MSENEQLSQTTGGTEVMEFDLSTAAPVEGFSGGIVANHVIVRAADNLFVLDFLRAVASPSPEGMAPDVSLLERVYLSPMLMKGLVSALENVIARYQQRWGIELPNLKELRQRKEKN